MKESLDRRNFLKAVSLSGVVVITTPAFSTSAQEAARRKKWRMRLSTSSIHFMKLPIEQACERIAKLGFKAIDI